MYKWIMTTPFMIMSMLEMMVDALKKRKEAYERASANLKKYTGARIPYVPVSLDAGNVKLKFQFKMLRQL